MHTKACCCLGRLYIDIFFSRKWKGLYNRFSQRIIGSFYIFFCNMRAKSSLPQEGSTISGCIFNHFSSIWPRRAPPHIGHTPVFVRINKTSKWMFNEHFTSSCWWPRLDAFFSTIRLWQLSGLNFAECRLLAFTSPPEDCKYPSHCFGLAVENHDFSLEKICIR